jgi:hypothetical protein
MTLSASGESTVIGSAFQSFDDRGDVRFRQPFAAMCHHEAISHVVRPKKGDERFVRLRARKNVKIVGPIILVLQVPAEGKRGIDDPLAHIRWPS